MSVPALSRTCCIAGLISGALVLPFSFTGVPGGFVGKALAVTVGLGVAVFLIATLVLWILDFVVLARTWQSRDLAQNIAHICVLLVLTGFAAYISYFLLRPSNKPTDDGLKLA